VLETIVDFVLVDDERSPMIILYFKSTVRLNGLTLGLLTVAFPDISNIYRIFIDIAQQAGMF
jgi:hypothetical protein